MYTNKKLRNIAKLFSPRSIAIIGASKDTTKVGSTIVANLISSRFPGKIFPVNPNYKRVLGLKAFSKVSKIPHRVDIAVMAIPGKYILDVIKDCGKKNVKVLIVISAGFGEVSEEGKELEEKAMKLAEKNNISLLGPNCLGLISTESKLNASFAASNAIIGDVAFMSQSGAVCTSILDSANLQNLGFSHFVSLGNKVDINENDLLEYWLKSNKVSVIGMYLEEFVDGYDLVHMKNKLELEKPIVALHPGKTKAAQSAISSHTGSIAGSSETISTALESQGIIEVNSIREMTNTLKAFSWSKLPKSESTVVITNAGGPGIIATDILIKSGLNLTTLNKGTVSALKNILPESASVNNPVDILGDADAQRYLSTLSVMEQATEVDSIIVILTPQIVTQIEDTAKVLISLSAKLKTPIIPIFLGGEFVSAGINRLQKQNIPAFTELEEGINALAKLWQYQKYLNSKRWKSIDIEDIQLKSQKNVSINATSELTPLPDAKVIELLAEFNIATPATAVVRNWEQVLEFVTQLESPAKLDDGNSGDFPQTFKNKYVLKATTEDVVHKTDFKALYLGIDSFAELKSSLTELQENVYKLTGKDYPHVLIQQQISTEEEIFIGCNRDGDEDVYEKTGKGFGHLLVVGKGGIYTEVYRDFARGIFPLTASEIKRIIDETKVSQVIHGARGKSPLAINKLVELIENLQKMLINYPEIKELDFNPVMLTHREALVADAKLFVQRSNRV